STRSVSIRLIRSRCSQALGNRQQFNRTDPSNRGVMVKRTPRDSTSSTNATTSENNTTPLLQTEPFAPTSPGCVAHTTSSRRLPQLIPLTCQAKYAADRAVRLGRVLINGRCPLSGVKRTDCAPAEHFGL